MAKPLFNRLLMARRPGLAHPFFHGIARGLQAVSAPAYRRMLDDNPVLDPDAVFWAFDTDGSGNPQDLLKGIGSITEARSASIYTQQADGTFAATAASTVAYAYESGEWWAVSAPAATNINTYSRDFSTQYLQSNVSLTTGKTGIDGTANAVEAEDASAVAIGSLGSPVTTITAGTQDVSFILRIKKEVSVPNSYPGMETLVASGTQRACIDPVNGTAISQAANPFDDVSVVDNGGFWAVVATVANDGVDVATRLTFLPAMRTTYSDGGNESSALGKFTVDQFEIYDDTSHAEAVALAKFPIFTSGASSTRDVCSARGDIANHGETQGVWYGEFMWPVDLSDTEAYQVLIGGATGDKVINVNPVAGKLSSNDGTTALQSAYEVLANVKARVGVAYGGSSRTITVNGISTSGAYDGSFSLAGTLRFANTIADQPVVYFRNIRRYEVDEATGKLLLARLAG